MDTHMKIELVFLFMTILASRILYLIHKITTGFSRISPNPGKKPRKTMICIGSGGHTTEMVELVQTLDFEKYNPRYYVMASSDITSAQKVENLENEKRVQSGKESSSYYILKIPRSRFVGQSYITSVFTTAYSILRSIPVVLYIRPDLILCNGPGTCIPICVTSFLLKCNFITDTKIVFIESFCRTKTFSLSGRILTYFADNFLVQWPELKSKMKRAEYIGQLM